MKFNFVYQVNIELNFFSWEISEFSQHTHQQNVFLVGIAFDFKRAIKDSDLNPLEGLLKQCWASPPEFLIQ